MFIIRMPSTATPRVVSSMPMRSSLGTGAGSEAIEIKSRELSSGPGSDYGTIYPLVEPTSSTRAAIAGLHPVNLQISVALVIFVATIATSLIGLFGSPKLLDRSLFRPYWFLRRRQYDTVIMSGFVHADLMHLIFNMMTFYFFGFMLEQAIGSTHFLLLYFAGLLISHAGT